MVKEGERDTEREKTNVYYLPLCLTDRQAIGLTNCDIPGWCMMVVYDITRMDRHPWLSALFPFHTGPLKRIDAHSRIRTIHPRAPMRIEAFYSPTGSAF